MDCLLIFPPSDPKLFTDSAADLMRKAEGTLGFWCARTSFPITLGYVASTLKDYDIQVLDASVQELDYREVKRQVERSNPRIVIVSLCQDRWICPTPIYEPARKIAEIVKEVNDVARVIAYGPQATYSPVQFLLRNKCFDYLVRGEPEFICDSLVKAILTGGEIPRRVAYRRNGDIVCDSRVEYGNLDELPMPAYAQFFPREYLRNVVESSFPIESSRGCPYNCSFCNNEVVGKVHRLKNPRRLVDEIGYLLNNYGIDRFTFVDQTFTLDHAHVRGICEEILARRLEISWRCETRADLVTEDLLRFMRKAGCVDILYGVESLSEEVLRRSGKGISPDQVAKAISLTKRSEISAQVFMILGLPGESEESFLESIQAIQGMDVDSFYVTKATPTPGTPLYWEGVKTGMIQHGQDWDQDWAQALDACGLIATQLSHEKLRELYKVAIRDRRIYRLRKRYGRLYFLNPRLYPAAIRYAFRSLSQT